MFSTITVAAKKQNNGVVKISFMSLELCDCLFEFGFERESLRYFLFRDVKGLAVFLSSNH
jgi:hypothetical protein